MSETHIHTLLLQDAAAQIIANPSASHCWLRLKNYYQQIDNAPVKKELIAHLRMLTPDVGVAGFLKATWMVSILDDDSLLAEAGQITQDITPLDPDRLIAFMAFSWARILKHIHNRTAFSQAIRDAFFPEIVHKLGQHLRQQSTIRPPVRKIEYIKKVAIITPQLSNYPHAPTGMVLNQARILIEQGMTVALFSCLDFAAPGMMHLLGAGESITMGAFEADKWGSQCLPGITIYESVECFSMMGRWTNMLLHVAAFDPDLVMSVGFYSPLIAPLYEVRPVLGLNVHSVAPLDPVDVWLCASPEDAGELHTEWGNGLSNGFGWYHPYRVRRKQTVTALSRQELALPEESLILISVGYRLDIEIGGAWAGRMIDLLRDNPQVIWLLVGDKNTMPPALEHAPPRQVRAFCGRNDIPALFQCCDIYINPPRMGGGFSVAEAMAEGLPVVTYGDSDGGCKVGSTAVNSDADYFSKLAALLVSTDLRGQEGAAMQALFSSTLDLEASSPSLLAACDYALQCFSLRTTPMIS
jgi:hypothetical protein